MGKTLEQYLAGLTGAQMSAATLKLWSQAGGVETGAETLERWRAGALRIRFENIASAEPSLESMLLQGTVIKTLTVPAYTAVDFADAVRLGKFNNDTADIAHQFKEEPVGLAVPAQVELVEFDREWWRDEAIAWGKTNDSKKPIYPAHLLGIAIGLPDEQRNRPIAELDSGSRGGVLCLRGDSTRRDLRCGAVGSHWLRRCLVGFVSKSA